MFTTSGTVVQTESLMKLISNAIATLGIPLIICVIAMILFDMIRYAGESCETCDAANNYTTPIGYPNLCVFDRCRPDSCGCSDATCGVKFGTCATNVSGSPVCQCSPQYTGDSCQSCLITSLTWPNCVPAEVCIVAIYYGFLTFPVVPMCARKLCRQRTDLPLRLLLVRSYLQRVQSKLCWRQLQRVR